MVPAKKSSSTNPVGLPPVKRARLGKSQKQLTLSGNPVDPDAPAKLDVAFAHAVHGHLLSNTLGESVLWQRVIDIARTLPSNYTLPGKDKVGGPLLDYIHRQNYVSAVTSLLKESRIFGVCVCGDMATIGKFPLLNFLGAGVNNPYALLAIVDQIDQAAAVETKYAPYIAHPALAIWRSRKTLKIISAGVAKGL